MGRVIQTGQDGHGVYARAHPGLRKLAHGLQALRGRWGFGLQETRHPLIGCSHGHVDAEAMPRSHPPQQLEVAKNQHGLRGNGKVNSTELREDLENAFGNFKLAFRRLVGIGGRTQGDRQAFVHSPAKFGPENLRRARLGINLSFEVATVPHFHEFVRVTRVAVVAAKLASTIGVDGPGERHASARLAIQSGTRFQPGEELDLRALSDQGASGRQARDANQRHLLRSGSGCEA